MFKPLYCTVNADVGGGTIPIKREKRKIAPHT